MLTDQRGNTYRVTRIESASVQVGGGGKLWDSHGMQKRALSYRVPETFIHYEKMSARYAHLGFSDETKSSLQAFAFELEKQSKVDTASKIRLPPLNRRKGAY